MNARVLAWLAVSTAMTCGCEVKRISEEVSQAQLARVAVDAATLCGAGCSSRTGYTLTCTSNQSQYFGWCPESNICSVMDSCQAQQLADCNAACPGGCIATSTDVVSCCDCDLLPSDLGPAYDAVDAYRPVDAVDAYRPVDLAECHPSCFFVPCGAFDGCGGICYPGSGCFPTGGSDLATNDLGSDLGPSDGSDLALPSDGSVADLPVADLARYDLAYPSDLSDSDGSGDGGCEPGDAGAHEIVSTLDQLLEGGGLSAIITGSTRVSGRTDVEELLENGYLTLRFDLPGVCESTPVTGMFMPDPTGDPIDPPPSASDPYPRTFADLRLQFRAELARRIHSASSTVKTFPADFIGRLGPAPAGIPILTLPDDVKCEHGLFDPDHACDRDLEVAQRFGLLMQLDLNELRSSAHAIPPFLATDLIVGQHAAEQGWSFAADLPLPDSSSGDRYSFVPVVLSRAHAVIGYVAEGGLDSDDFFTAVDVWGWLAVNLITSPLPPFSLEDTQRFSDDETAWPSLNPIFPSERSFRFESHVYEIGGVGACF